MGYKIFIEYKRGKYDRLINGYEFDTALYETETSTTVYPSESRCALKLCQNDDLCFDLSSADAYHCACRYPYTGVHCQIQERFFSERTCGTKTLDIVPFCHGFTSDKALPYICACYIKNVPGESFIALNNCHSENAFHKVCDGNEPFVGALSFTNKAFYICPSDMFNVVVKSRDIDHVWNDTQKECVPE
ncbi:unnamed protein product [Rotaria sp. Silwood2]|nr:unnamed protein product [Rotaria sp. Silwood2]CAF4212410.1 unnamed protein product [Rotaria sp. Silwood2]